MKKHFLKFLVVAVLLVQLAVPLVASADLGGAKPGNLPSEPGATPGAFAGCSTTSSPLGCAVVNIVNIIMAVVFLIAVIMLIMGGFRYVISQGNEEAVEKAKGTITNAIIGIVIVVLAWVIMTAIRALLDKGAAAGA